MRIIFGAALTPYPFSPGMAWNWMHHAVGFKKLGHDLCYVEEVRPDWCVDQQGRHCDFKHSLQCKLFQTTLERFGLMDTACQIYDGGRATFGMSLDALVAVCNEADLLINISGHVTADAVLNRVKRRVYVDQDPVYTQLWNAVYGKDLNLQAHEAFLSVGWNIGTPHTPIPDCGVTWSHYLPPIVLDYWPVQIDPSCRRFSTVASWSGYSDLCYQGDWYRSKHEEFQRFSELPRVADQEMEVVLKAFRASDPGIQHLREGGWMVKEAADVADLSSYQQHLASCRAEIGIAKNAYVKGCSGWFSDRAAHFLGSGKPVLAQSTGFERWLPTGQGLLTFRNLSEAVAGVQRINRNYEFHCRAARRFAEEYLDYRKVLPKMLEVCMGGATSPLP